MKSSFEGKTVLVVGGSSGMGLGVAQAAVAAGARVHIVGRSDDKLQRAASKLGTDVTTHLVNIAEEEEVAALAEKIGGLDHLVVTAADLVFKPFKDISNDEIEKVLAAKFWGVIYLTRHLAPRMAKDGSITFFSGSAAYKALAGGSIVAAANAALDGLTRTLALELSPVRVNVISPGFVDTPAWDFLPAESRADALKDIGAGLPLGRVGKVEELADAAMFVMGNGFTTGAVLQIDGGTNA